MPWRNDSSLWEKLQGSNNAAIRKNKSILHLRYHMKFYDVLFVDEDLYSNVANLASTYICLCGAGLSHVGWLVFVYADGSGQKDW